MDMVHEKPVSESSLWLENLVDGLSGVTIKAKHAICCESSPFQKIEVFDTYAFGRILVLGGTIVFTEKDENIYNEMITHPALISHRNPAEVCIIGGGDGGCVREALRHKAAGKITVIEIDKKVTEIIRAHFSSLAKGFDNPRVTVNFKDGYAWLQSSKAKFDVIIVDSYDPGGPVQSLETANFVEVVASSLKPGGIAAFQTSSPELCREKISQTMRNLSAFFTWRAPYCATIPSFPLGMCSFVLCGIEGDNPPEPDAKRMQTVQDKCRYYCADIHRGAFLLPRSVAEIFRA